MAYSDGKRIAIAEAIALMANNATIADNMRDLFLHPYSIDNAKEFITKNINGQIKGVFAIIYKGNLAGSMVYIHNQMSILKQLNWVIM